MCNCIVFIPWYCKFLISVCNISFTEVQGSRFKVRGSRFEVRGSRFEVRGSRFEVRGSRFEEFKNLTVNIASFFIPVGGSLPHAGFNKMRGIPPAYVQYKHHTWLNLYLKPLSLIFFSVDSVTSEDSVASVINSVLVFFTTENTEALRATQRRKSCAG